MDKQREAFEKWYLADKLNNSTKAGVKAFVRFNREPHGYLDGHVQTCFEGWQAAIALQQADIARLRDALVKIATMPPSTAQPDPHAHSWKAFAEHTMAYATDMKFVAINALKENT
jgi:hypothetical protein